MAMSKEKAVQKAFDTCNLIGEDVNIYDVMYRYKSIRELPEEEFEEVYEEIAERLGFKWGCK